MEDEKSSLTVNVSIKDTDEFSVILKLLNDMFMDERIQKEVRTEYSRRLLEISKVGD